MPSIMISDTVYTKLQRIAKPFIDTEDSAIARVLDFYLEENGITTDGKAQVAPKLENAVRLNPDSGKLTHTRLISAVVNGAAHHRPKWNSLVTALHVMAFRRLGSYDAVRKISPSNIRQGRYEQDGYHFQPDAELSIQGVDANLACAHSFQLAKALRIPLSVSFEWRDKKDAAYPGKTGLIEWTPNGD